MSLQLTQTNAVKNLVDQIIEFTIKTIVLNESERLVLVNKVKELIVYTPKKKPEPKNKVSSDEVVVPVVVHDVVPDVVPDVENKKTEPTESPTEEKVSKPKAAPRKKPAAKKELPTESETIVTEPLSVEQLIAPPVVKAPKKKTAKKEVVEKASFVEETTEEKDGIAVKKVLIKGKKYLKSSDNILYDIETQEVIGEWSDEKKEIIALQKEEYQY